MKKLIQFFVVILTLFFLSPLLVQALETSPTPLLVDGVNKKKKKVRKKVVRKKVVKPKLTSSTPLVEVYGSTDFPRLVINVRFQPLFTQPVKYVEGKIIPVQEDGSPAESFINPKDRELLEKIVAETKPTDAVFNYTAASRVNTSINTIALEKERWTQSDVDVIIRLIEAYFSPIKIGRTPDVFSNHPILLTAGNDNPKP